MPDEITMAIATTLATKGAEALAAGAQSAISALARFVRARLGRDANESPSASALAEALRRAMADDPEFAASVRDLWRRASAELAADRDGVVNQFSGTGEKIVQARDITGNITF